MNLNMMPPECSSEIEVHRAKQEFPILGWNGQRKDGFLRSMEVSYSGNNGCYISFLHFGKRKIGKRWQLI
jgi:hypothetical protein